MSFKATATLTAVVTFVLGAGYFFAGQLLVGRWGIEPTESILLLGRRMGAAYLGLSIIFMFARSAAPSVARSALAAGAVVTCLLLAVLGVYEFSAGHATAPILGSAALEAFLSAAFARILVVDHGVMLRRPGKAA